MRVCLVILASGCWTNTPAPVATTVTNHRTDPCVIDERMIETTSRPELMIDGRPFARVSTEVDRLHVQFDGERARAKIETEELEVAGDLALDEILIRPKSREPHEHWLVIDGARAREGNAGKLDLAVELPMGVEPRFARVTFPCTALTFAMLPEEDEELPERSWVEFAPGRTPLAPTPGAPPVATVVVGPKHPDDDPVQARIVEARADILHVELVGTHSIVSGWVPRARTSPTEWSGRGGFGFGRTGFSKDTISCSDPVPIYVGNHVRVGRYKPDVTITIETEQSDRYVVDLGVDAPIAYIEKRDVDECS